MDSNMQKEHFTLKDSVENEENLSTRLEPFFRDLDCFLDRELTTMIETVTCLRILEILSGLYSEPEIAEGIGLRGWGTDR